MLLLNRRWSDREHLQRRIAAASDYLQRMLGALILTGGASSRMGEDKAAADWLGRRAVDRVAQLAADLGALVTLTVGRWSYGLPFVADLVPLGGPTGGVIAGMAALAHRGCDVGLVLAVDAPTLRRADVTPLLSHVRPGAAYVGRHLPLVMAVDALPPDAEPDWPLARLIERGGLQRLACPPEAASRLRGANTPAEKQALVQALAAYEASVGRMEP